MTEDFIERMNLAAEKAMKRTKKIDEEYLLKREKNKVYADLYFALLFSVVETYNYQTGKFMVQNVDKEILAAFSPKGIRVYAIDLEGRSEIHLNYEGSDGKREGEPSFKKDQFFDLEVLNDILGENNVFLRENHINSDRIGVEEDILVFDASILVKARETYYKEATQKIIK